MSLLSRNREVWLRRADAFSNSRWGVALLALIAFADSSVLPLMPDLFLVPMLLLLPPATVPALVAGAMALANVDRCFRRTLHAQRLALSLADAMSTQPVEFSDDSKELYWLDSRGRDKAAAVAQDLATGATRVLAENGKADMVEMLLEPGSYRPIASACVHARTHWHVIDRAYAGGGSGGEGGG